MFCLMVDYFLGRISAEKQLKLSCLNNLSRFWAGWGMLYVWKINVLRNYLLSTCTAWGILLVKIINTDQNIPDDWNYWFNQNKNFFYISVPKFKVISRIVTFFLFRRFSKIPFMGPYNAGSNFTPAPLTPALITLVSKIPFPPFRAGVIRAHKVNPSKSSSSPCPCNENICPKRVFRELLMK